MNKMQICAVFSWQMLALRFGKFESQVLGGIRVRRFFRSCRRVACPNHVEVSSARHYKFRRSEIKQWDEILGAVGALRRSARVIAAAGFVGEGI